MMYPKVIDVKPTENYNIIITYETGERKKFDVNPYIKGAWYGELKNISIFNSVRPCGNTVEWAGGQDIAPHELFELSDAV